jgi:glycosyltransferase involved in cell wall biosynthesis
MRKISICIPYYNRADMVMETLAYPLSDDRIDEIILCDDCSPIEDYHKLVENTKGLQKIRIVKNVRNWHNQHNKRNCLSFAKNEWVILLDNDNIINKDFVDKLFAIENWDRNTIYHPAFASPNFSYKQFNNQTITKDNVSNYCHHNIFVTLLNTNNYFVNRDEYLRTYQYDKTVRGADGIYFAHNWLKEGNKIYIVEDLTYYHRVHAGSEFLHERDSNMKLIMMWLERVKQLK